MERWTHSPGVYDSVRLTTPPNSLGLWLCGGGLPRGGPGLALAKSAKESSSCRLWWIVGVNVSVGVCVCVSVGIRIGVGVGVGLGVVSCLRQR